MFSFWIALYFHCIGSEYKPYKCQLWREIKLTILSKTKTHSCFCFLFFFFFLRRFITNAPCFHFIVSFVDKVDLESEKQTCKLSLISVKDRRVGAGLAEDVTCREHRNFWRFPRVACPPSLARVPVCCSPFCLSPTLGTTRSSLTSFKTRSDTVKSNSANLATD